MTQLIQMRSRIKAIDTIAKITHAMQLIAMADHLRLRERKMVFEQYQQKIAQLFQRMRTRKPTTQEEKPAVEKVLLIIIGSQKGLCGSFNSNLAYEAEKAFSGQTYEQADLILIGKKLKDYAKSMRQSFPFETKVVAEHNNFVWANMPTIGQALLSYALDPALGYTKVLLFGQQPAGFFAQKIQTIQLLPITESPSPEAAPEYTWEQDPTIVLAHVRELYLLSMIEFVLLQSLLAEQASRFVSMDAATRNTKKLREHMQTQFNKMRQAKITKELTELAPSI